MGDKKSQSIFLKKIQQIYIPWLIILSICLFSFGGIVYALDSIGGDILLQQATGTGSNDSIIWVSTGGISTVYINKDDDSTVSGNYFSGYYYDTINGFYKFNWDTSNASKNNVHVSGITDVCGNGILGYKLSGYAKGDTGGYMNFSFSDTIFVYYCENDRKLRGFAFNDSEGLQNFNGITFDINANTTNISIAPSATNDQNFVNNFSRITDPYAITNDAEKISVFYIIK